MRITRLGPAGWDIVTGIALLGLSAVVLWQAERLPPPIFDPIGSAFLPRAVALVIAGLSLVMIAGALSAARAELAQDNGGGDAAGSRSAAGRGLAVVVMLAVYGVLLESGMVGFTAATALFVAATGTLLSRGNHRVMVASVVTGIVLAVACRYVFTQIFYIDLP